MDIATLVIQLLSGAAGGNVAGKLFGGLSLGGLGNTLAGLIGGGLGSQILNSLLGTAATAATATAVGPDLDLTALATQILGGGVGGSAMMLLVGVLKQIFHR